MAAVNVLISTDIGVVERQLADFANELQEKTGVRLLRVSFDWISLDQIGHKSSVVVRISVGSEKFIP